MKQLNQLLNLQEAIKQAVDPLALIHRVVHEALELILRADGAAVELINDEGYLIYTSAGGLLEPYIGTKLEMGKSLSGLAISQSSILYSHNTQLDPRVDSKLCLQMKILSMICVPLYNKDKPVGALKVSSSLPFALKNEDIEGLTKLANFVSVVISAASDIANATTSLFSSFPLPVCPQEAKSLNTLNEFDSNKSNDITTFVANILSPGSVQNLKKRQRIENILKDNSITMLCQPILNLTTDKIMGVEALARFLKPPKRTPDVWFKEAHSVGLGEQLELLAVSMALELLDELPPHLSLALNVGPETVTTTEFLELIRNSPSNRIIVELTEHVEIHDYTNVKQSLIKLREIGVRLAIDDTGAGFASLAHILELNPELIKLDKDLTKGIDKDPIRRSLASSLVAFASESGSNIIAEGIETIEELKALQDLGIDFGQGFYLSHPVPLENIINQN